MALNRKWQNFWGGMLSGTAGENGEYQSFVLYAPIMNKRIIIDDFDTQLVYDKNGIEQFYKWLLVNFIH